jgi:hypothetical protein
MPEADKNIRREKPTAMGQYEPAWKGFLKMRAMIRAPLMATVF